METLTELWRELGLEVAGQILSPGSRTYWPFLLAAALLILIVGRRDSADLAPHERVGSRATWFSRSAINDYGLILVNAALFALALDALRPDGGAITQAVSGALPQLAANSTWWAPVALAAALFVVDDFVRFFAHWAEHRVPWLWELHKVHHSATALNFITAERHHPLALVWFQLLAIPTAALVNGVFIALFADSLSPAALIGGNVFWIAANLIGGALRHSPVWLSFGPRIERWLISPAQHQIHHSNDPKHFDRNFGGTLAIWDRLFGTLYTTTPARERIGYGLGEETARYESLAQLYVEPVKRIVVSLWPKRFSPRFA